MRQRLLALAAIVAAAAVGSVAVAPSMANHRVLSNGAALARTPSIRVVVKAGAARGDWPRPHSDGSASRLADAALPQNPDIVARGQLAREIKAASRLISSRALTVRTHRADAMARAAARIMRFLRAQRVLPRPVRWTERRRADGQIVIEIGLGGPP